MLSSDNGKVTYPGFLFDNLSSQARFHDPGASTIFSHSGNVASFSEWRSRSSSREGSPDRRSPAHLHPPAGLHASLEKSTSLLTVQTRKGALHLPSLQTPKSSGKRVRYCIYEYEKLVDSSDIGFNDWIRMAEDIEYNYQAYDAFILLHGTDTMAYTVCRHQFTGYRVGCY